MLTLPLVFHHRCNFSRRSNNAWSLRQAVRSLLNVSSLMGLKTGKSRLSLVITDALSSRPLSPQSTHSDCHCYCCHHCHHPPGSTVLIVTSLVTIVAANCICLQKKALGSERKEKNAQLFWLLVSGKYHLASTNRSDMSEQRFLSLRKWTGRERLTPWECTRPIEATLPERKRFWCGKKTSQGWSPLLQHSCHQ
jgi:hypothetical protein